MACLGLGAGLISIYGFFIQPLSTEFGVGAAVLNLGPVALLLMPGFVGPVVGKLVDRIPIRRIMLTGATVAMFSLLVISQAPLLWMAGCCFLVFALGLAMYGPVAVNGMLVKLYPGREARALAIAAMGISVATMVLPPLMGYLLLLLDWRGALLSLAAGVLVLLWLLILLGVPRDVGPAPEQEGGPPKKPQLYSDARFWLIGLSVAMALTGAVVLAISYPPHFTSRGFSVAQAGWFISMAGLAGIFGKFGVAVVGDVVSRHAKWLAAFILFLQVVGMVLLLDAQTTAQVIPAVCLLGFGGGAFLPMQPYLNSQYFDVAVIGQVNGAQMPMFLPFGLVGLPLAGYVYDQTGSYGPVITTLVVVLVIATLLVLLLPSSRES